MMSPVAITSPRRKNTTVSPSVCRRGHVNDLNAFAVQVHRVQPEGECLRGPEREREGLRTRCGRHPGQHVFVRQHAGPARVGDQVVVQPRAGRDSARQDAESGPGELVIPADVIGVHARVDDVADRQAASAGGSSPGPCPPLAVEPESTRITPSGPVCTTMLPPAPAMT